MWREAVLRRAGGGEHAAPRGQEPGGAAAQLPAPSSTLPAPEEQEDALGRGQDGEVVGGDVEAAQVHNHHRNLRALAKV